jgi:hypothetical protein
MLFLKYSLQKSSKKVQFLFEKSKLTLCTQKQSVDGLNTKKIVATTILTTLTIGLCNYGCTYLYNMDFSLKWRIAIDMKKNPEFVDYTTNQNSYYIANVPFQTEILKTLAGGLERGGVYVLAAPPHTGKSAHLQEIISKLMEKKRYIYVKKIIFTGEEDVSFTNIRKKLNIPIDRDLEDFLPSGSWIVIDQFDRKRELTDTEKDVFTSLASLSFNSGGKFAVLVTVSFANIFQSILDCNGKRKIFPACDPKLLQIDKEMMKEYIRKIQPNGDIDVLANKCESSKSIGTTRDVALYGKSQNEKPEWEIFSKVYDGFYGENIGLFSWFKKIIYF